MAERVEPRQHQPLLRKSIKSELDEWDLGKFSSMNFWRRKHGSSGEKSTRTKYTGEDILQNGVLDVESRLGEGGMGQVYFARNKEDGTAVAVKVGKDGPDRIGIKSQLAEIIVRDRLPDDGHENVVKAYGFCDRSPGCPIFLEACNGGDLFEAAVDGYLMKNVEVLGLVQGVVSALGFLHEHGIIHSDVKAENILLQANGRGGYTPKLTDFGGAMEAGEDRQGGGTFGYTAPEVIFGTHPAHGSQDAWAVGHMLLVMLTKRRYRNSNMFKHSRLLTEADHALKATMARVGEDDMFERYLTFRNMRDVRTLDILLSKDMFDEEIAKLPQVLGGIRQLLHLDAAERPPMPVVHGWLGLVITGLNATVRAGSRTSPEDSTDDSPTSERLLASSSPGITPASTGTRAEARPASPPLGVPAAGAKGMPPLPPPPSVRVNGNKNDPCLPPPPGFQPIGAKNDRYFSRPPAEDSAAVREVHATPLPLRPNESTEAVRADTEARTPTSTAHGGEIGSCPSTTSTVAETEGVASLASRIDKLSDLPPQEFDDVPAAAQHMGGQPVIAMPLTGGDTVTPGPAAVGQAGYRSRNNSSRNGVEGCPRPARTAVLGMCGFPAAIRQYDVTPRTSDATFLGIGQQCAAPTTAVHERSVPGMTQATGGPSSHYSRGPPPSYARGAYGVSAAGWRTQGGPPSRPPPSSWAPGQGEGYGWWAGHMPGGPCFPRREANEFQNRYHRGGVQGQRFFTSRNNKNDHHPRHYNHQHNGYAMRAEVPANGKHGARKSKGRRGGPTNWPSGHSQQTKRDPGGVAGYPVGLTVPHAIAVNGAGLYCPGGGGGFYPGQWQGYPVGAW